MAMACSLQGEPENTPTCIFLEHFSSGLWKDADVPKYHLGIQTSFFLDPRERLLTPKLQYWHLAKAQHFQHTMWVWGNSHPLWDDTSNRLLC